MATQTTLQSSPQGSSQTPSTTAFLSSSPDYQTLMTDIKASIDKNDKLFNTIQESNYPDAGKYTSDLLNYKIDTQVTDLTKARTQIWDFLTKKYEENTKLRTYYFSEIRKIENNIKNLEQEKKEVLDSIESYNIKTNTAIKNVKNGKYVYNKMEYYLFLYKALVFVQMAILLVITLCILGMIPKTTCLVINIIILIATVAFVAYYVFFVNLGRNQFVWSKFEHDNGNFVAKGDQCYDDAEKAKAKAAMDTKIDGIINSSKSGKTCAL
jgi:hypothetical protein